MCLTWEECGWKVNLCNTYSGPQIDSETVSNTCLVGIYFSIYYVILFWGLYIKNRVKPYAAKVAVYRSVPQNQLLQSHGRSMWISLCLKILSQFVGHKNPSLLSKPYSNPSCETTRGAFAGKKEVQGYSLHGMGRDILFRPLSSRLCWY